MRLKRRDILKGALVSLASALPSAPGFADSTPPLPTRTLGRTGLKTTVLGYGAMQVSDPSIIRHGLDSGINYIDTADCYLGGRNEKVVGKAIQGIRDQVIIATKVHISREARMRKSVDRSLASLGVKTVDLMQLHGLYSRDQVVRKDVQKAMARMQREGKFKFTAVTTHSNQVEVLDAVVEDGFYDAVLVAVNFRSPRALYKAIQRASDAGVGIIAMKTQNGGFQDSTWPELTPHQAALRYVLEKPSIHVAVPGMLSRKMISENLGSVAADKGLADIINLENYRLDLQGKACAFCSGCLDQCRSGTGGIDVARVLMYLEGYRDRHLALTNLLEARPRVELCIDCESCSVNCSQGIDIKAAAGKLAHYLT